VGSFRLLNQQVWLKWKKDAKIDAKCQACLVIRPDDLPAILKSGWASGGPKGLRRPASSQEMMLWTI
jgi:hypothetical protein